MNYYAARQIGPNGPAPGKWNWTRMNDGVISTASPCAHPDYEYPKDDPEGVIAGKYTPTGRERCDHDTKEDAERHFWESEAASLRRVEYTTADRCDGPHDGEAPWTPVSFAVMPVGADVHVCPEHEAAAIDIWKAKYPFVPGASVTSSW